MTQSPERKQKLEKIFGELSFSAIERLKRESGVAPTDTQWHLCGLMAKSFDDLRQEVLVMQLISYFQHIFRAEGLRLWLHPYRILSTGASTGLLEVVRNAISLDGIKKTPGFKNLRTHFLDIYGPTSAALTSDRDSGDSDASDDSDLLKQAELNFVHSLGTSLALMCLRSHTRHVLTGASCPLARAYEQRRTRSYATCSRSKTGTTATSCSTLRATSCTSTLASVRRCECLSRLLCRLSVDSP